MALLDWYVVTGKKLLCAALFELVSQFQGIVEAVGTVVGQKSDVNAHGFPWDWCGVT